MLPPKSQLELITAQITLIIGELITSRPESNLSIVDLGSYPICFLPLLDDVPASDFSRHSSSPSLSANFFSRPALQNSVAACSAISM